MLRGHTSWFTSSENAEDYASKLIALCRNPERMREAGEHAMNELYLSWEDSVRRAYAEYENVCRDYREHRHLPRNGKSDHFFRTVSKLYRYGKVSHLR